MRLELTRRGDYAIRAMVALAGANGDRLSVRRIAEAQSIPAAFLPRVMADLVGAGLADAASGRTGGYRLALDASRISLLDIIQAVEGDPRRRRCVLRGGPCRRDGACAVHGVFATAQDEMLRALAGSTIADVAQRGG
jgi:Rrf2 family protein